MKIEQLIEGISSVVYHATSTYATYEILKRDSIDLTPSFAKNVEGSKKLFFLSTTRTRTGKYHVDNMANSALIRLDGRKLSYTFSGDPMDYWGPDFRQYGGGEYEQEDRIWSDQGRIPNFTQYIESIDFLHDFGNRTNERTNDILIKTALMCHQNNIPFRIYDNNRDWISGSTNTVPLSRLKDLNREEDPDSVNYRNKRDALKNMRSNSDLAVIYKLMIFDDLSSFTMDERAMVRRYTLRMDAPGTVAAELHNASSKHEDRKLLELIGKEMRKQNIQSPRELGMWLADKWNGRT